MPRRKRWPNKPPNCRRISARPRSNWRRRDASWPARALMNCWPHPATPTACGCWWPRCRPIRRTCCARWPIGIAQNFASGVVVLGAVIGDKPSLLAAVTKDLATAKKVDAGKLIKEIAPIVGGGGGGRPDLAQAGGKDPAKLGEALDKARQILAVVIVRRVWYHSNCLRACSSVVRAVGS